MTVKTIIEKYISFFEKRGHKKIPNSPLVPENDPTTLFTSSGMQPLIPYLLGEPHPQGRRFVNVQNCFRAADIDEVGDNRHTTFFRMLGNWSLGDYFKKEQLSWFFEFLTSKNEGLGLAPQRLYVTVFEGDRQIPKDNESIKLWKEIFANVGIEAKEGERIFVYGVDKNWWSRAGGPDEMPPGEPGGPDSEVFYQFEVPHDSKFGPGCHPNCQCGRFLEIGNSVFMEYQKKKDGSFAHLSQKNVDFGGGLERLLAAMEDQPDLFQSRLFLPIIRTIEQQTNRSYKKESQSMRIIADHLVATVFIIANNVTPSNKEQGYVLRRLIRRALDSFSRLKGENLPLIIEVIASQYKETGSDFEEKFERIKNTLLEEKEAYQQTFDQAKRLIEKRYKLPRISAEDAFTLYSTHGLSPTQIESLGFIFDKQEFAQKMEEHQRVSRRGLEKKFAGGLADQSGQTVKGHTATHLLHQALCDVLGEHVYQTGSNITAERIRFDFNFERKPTSEEIRRIERIVNKKISENLPVDFRMLMAEEAKKIGAIGLFGKKYQDRVKVYFIGDYSKEFCGGPHVRFTGKLKRFKIKKEEGLGKGKRRIYAILEPS